MMKRDNIFTSEENAAIDLLIERGFMAFDDALIDDVVDPARKTGRRTYRHRGRFDMVLALSKARIPAPAADPPARKKRPAKKAASE